MYYAGTRHGRMWRAHQEGSEADVIAKLVLHELRESVVLGAQGVHPLPDLSPVACSQALLYHIAGTLVAAQLHDVVP